MLKDNCGRVNKYRLTCSLQSVIHDSDVFMAAGTSRTAHPLGFLRPRAETPRARTSGTAKFATNAPGKIWFLQPVPNLLEPALRLQH
jgi:hypothetical protein